MIYLVIALLTVSVLLIGELYGMRFELTAIAVSAAIVFALDRARA